MLPAILIILFLVGLVITLSGAQSQAHTDDRNALRHTIYVNLNILDAELITLEKLAASNSSSPESQEAQSLVMHAKSASVIARANVQSASNDELGEILGRVFDAMNKSTRARKLLSN